MTRTRAAQLHTGVRPRLAFKIHDRAHLFFDQRHALSGDTVGQQLAAAERIAADLERRGARWDSRRRTTDAGRILTPTDARRLRQEVAAIERAFYGTSVSMADMLRAGGRLVGLLSALADELDSWLTFWDAYRAEDPAGFAHDCATPEPAPNGAALEVAEPLEPLPPAHAVAQLTAAPCAPPAGVTAS